ncbi:MAG: hypothetical protein KIT54_04680 [Phycisphaeraceae bacterium]|nr:hypothetical protein [Phycisphaeraceae bacterium]
MPISPPLPDIWANIATVCLGALVVLLVVSILGWGLRRADARGRWLPPWLQTRLHLNAPTPAVARALRAHPSVCAACAYPVASGPRCPECGADYAQPGAVVHRDGLARGLPTVPRWLLMATVGVGLFALVLMLLPAGRAAGNWLYWGTPMPSPRQYHASYNPAPVAGQAPPAYEVIFEIHLFVDGRAEARGVRKPAVGGTVRMWFAASPGNPSSLPYTIKYDVRTGDWAFERYANRSNPIAPPAVLAGHGPRAAIDALYAYAGLDHAWAGSRAEMDDLETQLDMYLGGLHEVHRYRQAIPGGGPGLLGGSMSIWVPRPWHGDANAYSTALRIAAIVLPLLLAALVYRRLVRRATT